MEPLFAAVSGFIVSLAVLPLVIRYSKKKRLLHVPGGRRIHTKITPSLGGIAIFAGFIISSPLWMEHQRLSDAGSILLVLLVPLIMGLADDSLHLKPRYKLAGQVVTASLIFLFSDVKLTSLYGLFDLDVMLNPLVSYFVTLLSIIFITNSFNLIDGIDGLAGAIALIALLFFGSWFHFTDNHFYSVLSLALAGAIVAFLLLNWEPAKIFMGEIGSLLIGVMLAIFAIEFINSNYELPEDGKGKFLSSLGTVMCVLIIPLADTIRIILLRLSKGVSPFTPDKRHIHHCLVRLGLSHRLAVSILCAAHLLFIGVAILLRERGDWFVCSFAFATALLLCLLLDYSIARYTYQKK